MSRDILLVVSSKGDAHSDYLIRKLNEIGLGPKVVRFNTEDFINNCHLTFDLSNSYLYFKDSGRRVDVKDIISVWYRRPKEIQIPDTAGKYSNFIGEQTSAALSGFYYATHMDSKWINPLNVIAKSRLKLYQLQLAKRIGFNIPETIVTNSKDDLNSFLNKYNKISTKSLDYPNTKVDGILYPLYNRVIDKQQFIENINSIEWCPGLFQRYINKKFDVRVIVIGSVITAFAIYSQEKFESVEDVRGVSAFDLRHEVIDLPAELKAKINDFVFQQGLIFSAIDLIYGTDEKFYFLENNPNGQWVWLEEKTGYNLSSIFIKEAYYTKTGNKEFF